MSNLSSASKRAPTNSLLIVIAGYALANTAMQVLMNEVIDEYTLQSTAQGLMSSMISFGGLLSILLVPFLQGRVKKTVVVGVCSLMQALMLVVTGASPTFILLLGACILLGLSGGWIDNYTNSAMVDIHTSGSAKYMGLLHGWYGVGAILTPLVLQGLLYFTGWRNIYYITGGISLLVALQFIMVARRHNAVFAQTSDSETRLEKGNLKAFMADKYNLALVACVLFYSFSQNGLLGWVVRYMKVEHGAEAVGAICLSVYWVFATLSRFFAPRLGIAPIKLVCVGTLIAGVVHIVGVLSGSPALMVVMSGINGLVSGHCVPMLLHESLSRFPGHTSLPTSVMMLMIRISMMTMPLLLATVSAYSMPMSMLLTGFASLLAFVLSLVAQGVHRRADVGH